MPVLSPFLPFHLKYQLYSYHAQRVWVAEAFTQTALDRGHPCWEGGNRALQLHSQNPRLVLQRKKQTPPSSPFTPRPVTGHFSQTATKKPVVALLQKVFMGLHYKETTVFWLCLSFLSSLTGTEVLSDSRTPGTLSTCA